MRNNKKIIAIVLVSFLVIVGGYFAYSQLKDTSDTNEAPTRGMNDVDYSGPTKDEEEAGDAQKTSNEATETTQTASTKADVVIVDASRYGDIFEIRAYASNRFDSNATCTITLEKQGSPSVKRSVSANQSAQSTQCSTIDIPISSFGNNGKWQLTVQYASDGVTGLAKQEVTL